MPRRPSTKQTTLASPPPTPDTPALTSTSPSNFSLPSAALPTATTRKRAAPPPAPPGTDPASRTRKIIRIDPSNSTTTAPSTNAANNNNNNNTKSKPTRKTAHSIIERRRRSKMNAEFQTLKELVPACKGRELHKLEVLRETVGYVRWLEGMVEDLRSANVGSGSNRSSRSCSRERTAVTMTDGEEEEGGRASGEFVFASLPPPPPPPPPPQQQQKRLVKKEDQLLVNGYFPVSPATSPVWHETRREQTVSPFLGPLGGGGGELPSPLETTTAGALLLLAGEGGGGGGKEGSRGISVRDLLSS